MRQFPRMYAFNSTGASEANVARPGDDWGPGERAPHNGFNFQGVLANSSPRRQGKYTNRRKPVGRACSRSQSRLASAAEPTDCT